MLDRHTGLSCLHFSLTQKVHKVTVTPQQPAAIRAHAREPKSLHPTAASHSSSPSLCTPSIVNFKMGKRLSVEHCDKQQQTDQQQPSTPPSDGYSSKPGQLVDKDLHAARHEYLFSLPASWCNRLTALLRDPRDTPLALAFSNMLLLTLPAAVLLHVFKVQSHGVGLAYMLLSYALFLQVRRHRRSPPPSCV